MTIPIPEIRQYLTSAYSDDELGTLCADYFRDVYENFAAGMTKAQKIGLLLDYCQRREQLPNLRAALKRERPQQYPVHFAGDIVEVRPAAPQPQRDPRQVFISHAHGDAEFAHRLASDLQRNGWRVWIAPDSIRPGEKWAEAINRGLEESSVFVVALTPAAVASNWVKIETNLAIELAQGGEARFFPLLVSDAGRRCCGRRSNESFSAVDIPPAWRICWRHWSRKGSSHKRSSRRNRLLSPPLRQSHNPNQLCRG